MVPKEVVLEFRNRLELNVRRWVKVLREHVRELGTEAKEPVPSVSKGDNPALYFIKHLPGEHDQKKHGHGRAAWAEEFAYHGKSMTKGTKERKRKKLLEKYGDDDEFRMFGKAVSLYTQGFFEDIRKVGAAMATDTLEDLEANATGFFGGNLQPEADEEDPVMAIVGGLYEVFDVNGEEMHGNITYSFAQQLAHSLANAIEHAKPTDQPLYRGVTLSKNIKLEVGDTFDIPGSASFTRDKKMGEKFARGKMPGMFPRSGFRYVITVEGVNRAVDVDVLSPWHQQEALTNGRFEVVEFISASRHMDDHRPGAIGEITLKQQSVVDADYTGKVRYDLPKDVGKDLSPDERSMTTSVMSMIDSLIGPESERSVDLTRRVGNVDGISEEKVAVALRKLGYWVGIDPEWSKTTVVVRTEKYKKTPPVKGEAWDHRKETFEEYKRREWS